MESDLFSELERKWFSDGDNLEVPEFELPAEPPDPSFLLDELIELSRALAADGSDRQG